MRAARGLNPREALISRSPERSPNRKPLFLFPVQRQKREPAIKLSSNQPQLGSMLAYGAWTPKKLVYTYSQTKIAPTSGASAWCLETTTPPPRRGSLIPTH